MVISMPCILGSGVCDKSEEDWADKTVVFCTFWYVLKENCGPIHSLLCGPICVIISTYNTNNTVTEHMTVNIEIFTTFVIVNYS